MDRLSRFLKNTAGNVATTTAVLIIPLLAASGLAVDYSIMMREQSQIQNAADAAVLAGAKETQRQLIKGVPESTAINTGLDLAEKLFVTNSEKRGLELDGKFVPEIRLDGDAIKSDAQYNGKLSTNFMRVLGFEEANVEVFSAVNISPPQFTEIHFVVDNSQSMGVGATLADIRKLESAISCAFACHSPQPSNWTDKRGDIAASGAMTKIDVARDALSGIVDQLADENMGSTVSVAIHAMSNSLRTIAAPTTDFDEVRRRLNNLNLADMINEGGTIFAHSFGQLETEVGNSGDGRAIDRPKKIVVFVTDGVGGNVRVVQNGASTYDLGWGGDPNYIPYQDVINDYAPADNPTRGAIGAFDPNLCSRMKNAGGVEFYAIHTEYRTADFDTSLLNDENKWRVQLITNSVVPNVAVNLRQCASSDVNFFEATDGPGIRDAFQNVIEEILSDDLRVTG